MFMRASEPDDQSSSLASSSAIATFSASLRPLSCAGLGSPPPAGLVAGLGSGFFSCAALPAALPAASAVLTGSGGGSAGAALLGCALAVTAGRLLIFLVAGALFAGVRFGARKNRLGVAIKVVGIVLGLLIMAWPDATLNVISLIIAALLILTALVFLWSGYQIQKATHDISTTTF